MAQYIDKDALVAEIERLKTIYNDDENIHHVAKYNILVDILTFLNTLEVKEVDFEKELDRIWFDNRLGNYFDNDAMDFTHISTLCKHFFELGLKVAQKGE